MIWRFVALSMTLGCAGSVGGTEEDLGVHCWQPDGGIACEHCYRHATLVYECYDVPLDHEIEVEPDCSSGTCQRCFAFPGPEIVCQNQ